MMSLQFGSVVTKNFTTLSNIKHNIIVVSVGVGQTHLQTSLVAYILLAFLSGECTFYDHITRCFDRFKFCIALVSDLK